MSSNNWMEKIDPFFYILFTKNLFRGGLISIPLNGLHYPLNSPDCEDKLRNKQTEPA